MAWRSSGNNNTEMVDKLTRKQPIICHSMSLVSYYTLLLLCFAFAMHSVYYIACRLHTPSIRVARWLAL